MVGIRLAAAETMTRWQLESVKSPDKRSGVGGEYLPLRTVTRRSEIATHSGLEVGSARYQRAARQGTKQTSALCCYARARGTGQVHARGDLSSNVQYHNHHLIKSRRRHPLSFLNEFLIWGRLV